MVKFEQITKEINIKPEKGAFGYASITLLKDGIENILFDTGSYEVRNVIKEYCEDNNYQTDEVESGKQALNKLKVNDYDLMILDIMMPEMDGYSMLKESPLSYYLLVVKNMINLQDSI